MHMSVSFFSSSLISNLFFPLSRAPFFFFFLEKPHPYKQQDKESQPNKRAILLQQQIPVNPHRGPSVPLAIVSQPTTYLSHPIQAVPPIKQVFNVLRHDLGHIPQLIVDFIQVLGGPGIRIRRHRLGNEAVKVHVCIWAQRRRLQLLQRMGGEEFAGQVGEICEGQLARVAGVADAEEDDIAVDEVVDRVRGGFDGRLGRGVAR